MIGERTFRWEYPTENPLAIAQSDDVHMISGSSTEKSNEMVAVPLSVLQNSPSAKSAYEHALEKNSASRSVKSRKSEMSTPTRRGSIMITPKQGTSQRLIAVVSPQRRSQKIETSYSSGSEWRGLSCEMSTLEAVEMLESGLQNAKRPSTVSKKNKTLPVNTTLSRSLKALGNSRKRNRMSDVASSRKKILSQSMNLAARKSLGPMGSATSVGGTSMTSYSSVHFSSSKSTRISTESFKSSTSKVNQKSEYSRTSSTVSTVSTTKTPRKSFILQNTESLDLKSLEGNLSPRNSKTVNSSFETSMTSTSKRSSNSIFPSTITAKKQRTPRRSVMSSASKNSPSLRTVKVSTTRTSAKKSVTPPGKKSVTPPAKKSVTSSAKKSVTPTSKKSVSPKTSVTRRSVKLSVTKLTTKKNITPRRSLSLPFAPKSTTPRKSIGLSSATEIIIPRKSLNLSSTTNTPRESLRVSSTTKSITPRKSLDLSSTPKSTTPRTSLSLSSSSKSITPKTPTSEKSVTPKTRVSRGSVKLSVNKLSAKKNITPRKSLSLHSASKSTTLRKSIGVSPATEIIPRKSLSLSSTTKSNTPRESLRVSSTTKSTTPRKSLDLSSTPKSTTPRKSLSLSSSNKSIAPQTPTSEKSVTPKTRVYRVSVKLSVNKLSAKKNITPRKSLSLPSASKSTTLRKSIGVSPSTKIIPRKSLSLSSTNKSTTRRKSLKVSSTTKSTTPRRSLYLSSTPKSTTPTTSLSISSTSKNTTPLRSLDFSSTSKSATPRVSLRHSSATKSSTSRKSLNLSSFKLTPKVTNTSRRSVKSSSSKPTPRKSTTRRSVKISSTSLSESSSLSPAANQSTSRKTGSTKKEIKPKSVFKSNLKTPAKIMKRKLDADVRSAERAAKRLKFSKSPKTPDKKKMAALLLCHGKSPRTTVLTKKPLFSEVVKNRLNTVCASPSVVIKRTAFVKARAPHPSLVKKIKKKKPVPLSTVVPKTFNFNSTGHANSPENIVIFKQVSKIPVGTRKGRKDPISIKARKNIGEDKNLYSVEQLFSTPKSPAQKYRVTPHSKRNLKERVTPFNSTFIFGSDNASVSVSPSGSHTFITSSDSRSERKSVRFSPAVTFDSQYKPSPYINKHSQIVRRSIMKGGDSSSMSSAESLTQDQMSQDIISNVSPRKSTVKVGTPLSKKKSSEVENVDISKLRSTPRSGSIKDGSTSRNAENHTLRESSIHLSTSTSIITDSGHSSRKSVSSTFRRSVGRRNSNTPVESLPGAKSNVADVDLTPRRSSSIKEHTPLSNKMSEEKHITSPKIQSINKKHSLNDSSGRISRSSISTKMVISSPTIGHSGIKRSRISSPGADEQILIPMSRSTSKRIKLSEVSNNDLNNIRTSQISLPSPIFLRTPNANSSIRTGNKDRLSSSNRNVSLDSMDTDITAFDFSSVNTPNVPKEMFVSPLSNHQKSMNPTVIISKSQESGGRIEHSPQNSSIGRVGRAKVQLSPKSDSTDVSGIDVLLKTSREHRSPRNDLTDVRGVKGLLKTPRAQRSPKNDLRDVRGLKGLLKTPRPQRSPKNDLTDVRGVKGLLGTPRPQRSPKNDLTDLRGVKGLLGTPIPQRSPKNDLTDVRGVKGLLGTPRPQRSPRNDLTDVFGLKQLFNLPKLRGSPKNDLTEVTGVSRLFNDLWSLNKSPNSSYGSDSLIYDNVSNIGNTTAMKSESASNSKSSLRGKGLPTAVSALETPPRRGKKRQLTDSDIAVVEIRAVSPRQGRTIVKEVVNIYDEPTKQGTPRRRGRAAVKEVVNISDEPNKQGTPRRGRAAVKEVVNISDEPNKQGTPRRGQRAAVKEVVNISDEPTKQETPRRGHRTAVKEVVNISDEPNKQASPKRRGRAAAKEVTIVLTESDKEATSHKGRRGRAAAKELVESERDVTLVKGKKGATTVIERVNSSTESYEETSPVRGRRGKATAKMEVVTSSNKQGEQGASSREKRGGAVAKEVILTDELQVRSPSRGRRGRVAVKEVVTSLEEFDKEISISKITRSTAAKKASDVSHGQKSPNRGRRGRGVVKEVVTIPDEPQMKNTSNKVRGGRNGAKEVITIDDKPEEQVPPSKVRRGRTAAKEVVTSSNESDNPGIAKRRGRAATKELVTIPDEADVEGTIKKGKAATKRVHDISDDTEIEGSPIKVRRGRAATKKVVQTSSVTGMQVTPIKGRGRAAAKKVTISDEIQVQKTGIHERMGGAASKDEIAKEAHTQGSPIKQRQGRSAPKEVVGISNATCEVTLARKNRGKISKNEDNTDSETQLKAKTTKVGKSASAQDPETASPSAKRRKAVANDESKKLSPVMTRRTRARR